MVRSDSESDDDEARGRGKKGKAKAKAKPRAKADQVPPCPGVVSVPRLSLRPRAPGDASMIPCFLMRGLDKRCPDYISYIYIHIYIIYHIMAE